jgi:hypothetical protein
LVTISGIVWFDDGDGIRLDLDPEAEVDPEEPIEPELRAQAVPVTLYEADGTTVVATTATDADGVYEFTDVPEGAYLIRVEPLGGFTFAVAAAGGDEEFDSDISEIEEILYEDELVELFGWTDEIVAAEDMESGLIDAGLVPLPPDDDEESPPAEDPGEVAVEPPESPGSRDEDNTVDPHEPDDSVPDDDGAADGAAGESE